MAYDPSDFGQNSPEEAAAGIANAIASSRGEAQTYTTKDFQEPLFTISEPKLQATMQTVTGYSVSSKK